MRVLGIDPGTAITGWGVIEEDAGHIQALGMDVIRTPSKRPVEQRLLTIHESIFELFQQFSPHYLAAESVFFSRNVKTAMSVGQARGVSLLAAARAGCPVESFTPTEVKMAVTGYGAAAKQQIQAMVVQLLQLDETPQPDDAADALAVAVCCLHHVQSRDRINQGP